jgi:signal transduction histidine kinase
MRILGRSLSAVDLSPSAKRDALLLPSLFLLNSFVFSSWPQLGQSASKPWLLLAWLYGLATLAPLAWRDRAPMTVLFIESVLTVAAWPLMHLYIPVVGIPVALYAVSVHRSSRLALVALLLSCIPSEVAAAGTYQTPNNYSQDEYIQTFVSSSVLLVMAAMWAWGQGRLTRAIQRHLGQLERERQVIRDAELLAAERRRIAGDVHDTVSTAVTVIVLHTAVAERVVHTDITRVRQSLTLIETTARQTMHELRCLLGLLEANDPARGAEDGGELGPQLGLADLDGLFTKLDATGISVTTEVQGRPHKLDQPVDLAAYRIVQEGMTNAIKYGSEHSAPCLRLIWDNQKLLIQIDNEIGVAARQRQLALGWGHGLDGLREKARAVGGDLQAEAHQPNSWRLSATLPVAATAHGRREASPRDLPRPRTSRDGRWPRGKVRA